VVIGKQPVLARRTSCLGSAMQRQRGEKKRPKKQKTVELSRLTEQQQAEVRKAFEVFDADQSGEIDADELASAMEALGFNPSMTEVMSNNDAAAVFYVALACSRLA